MLDVNPLVAFYGFQGRKGEVLFFGSVPAHTDPKTLWVAMTIKIISTYGDIFV
jgi:hypothetical protein